MYDKWRSYKSDRDIPLVYLGPPPRPGEQWILTVENYLKWYTIYVVLPEGEVEPLSDEMWQRYDREHPMDSAWHDHVPNPDFCRWIPEAYPEYTWDGQAFDMIVGRLRNEYDGYP